MSALQRADKESVFERFVGSGFGSLFTEVDKAGFALSDGIDGSITLRAKRDLGPGRLTCALVCVKSDSRVVPTRNRRFGATRQAMSSELWRTEIEVESDLEIDNGTTMTFPFTMQLPTAPITPDEPNIPEWAAGTIAVLDSVTFRNTKIGWQLQARFDHPDGFSLRHNLPISVAIG